ncbi:hypothetical protein NDU88_001082 [Pleurodeles waltl]|uniref:Uncharacterized protein n=1 Tax=Pleurodeles waltl TaxID=8319 RepID=A0AAV7UT92_PLEWA|nr:hypothetical protein NDU88_001082 [Pleurodeles waltl]
MKTGGAPTDLKQCTNREERKQECPRLTLHLRVRSTRVAVITRKTVMQLNQGIKNLEGPSLRTPYRVTEQGHKEESPIGSLQKVGHSQ